MADLIPQPHGGALHPRVGSGTPAGGKASSFRAAKREMARLFREASVEAAAKMVETIQSKDERAAYVAAERVTTLVLGDNKAGMHDESTGEVNLSALDADERAQLMAALETVERLSRKAAEVGELGDV